MNEIKVTYAIMVQDGKFLVTQRGDRMARASKWEFPGGKIEKDETSEECIVREIKEELNVYISISRWLEPVSHSYPDIRIRLIPCIAKIVSGKIELKEHSNFRWITKEELNEQDWSPADIPVAQQLTELSF